MAKNDVLCAEILWTLQTISAHYSYKSNEKVGKIFQAMFPDSVIASKFSCREKKTAHLCTFGLAKHFKELLMDEVKGAFTILFDESLNSKSHQRQMDIHVRFWAGNQVNTRYLGSQFMGKGLFAPREILLFCKKICQRETIFSANDFFRPRKFCQASPNFKDTVE